MRVNIENCNNTGDPSAKEWVLGELVRNLKELRDRTDAGDMKALDEFFGLFVFNDDQDRKKVGGDETAVCPKCGKTRLAGGTHKGNSSAACYGLKPHNGEVRGASVTAQPACEASSREAATSTVVLAGTTGRKEA